MLRLNRSEGASLSRAVVLLAVAETASWGILFYAYAALFRPITRDLGTSETIATGAFSLGLLTSGLVAKRAGRAIDRLGARRVMTVAAFVAAASFLLLATVTHVVQLYLVWVLIGVAQAGVLYEPAFAALTSWFRVEHERLRALVVVTSVAGLASTIFLPLTGALVATVGWRTTVAVLAGVLACGVIPLHMRLPSPPRAAPQRRPSRTHEPIDGVAPVATVLAAQAFAATGMAVHLVTHLEDAGASGTDAAAIAGLMGISQVLGRLTSGWLRAVVGSRGRLALLLATQAVALGAMAGQLGVSTRVAVVLFGAANGLVTLERAVLVAERFGAERYGEVSGRIAGPSLVARAAAPLAVGIVRAQSGSTAAFWGLAVVLAAGALLFSCVHSRPVASERT